MQENTEARQKEHQLSVWESEMVSANRGAAINPSIDDTEIQYRLRKPHRLAKPSRILSKSEADMEFQYRPHIVDTDIDCGRHFCGRHFRDSYSGSDISRIQSAKRNQIHPPPLHTLKFPNAFVLNAVGRRNTQKSANEYESKSAKERKRALPCKIANNQVLN